MDDVDGDDDDDDEEEEEEDCAIIWCVINV